MQNTIMAQYSRKMEESFQDQIYYKFFMQDTMIQSNTKICYGRMISGLKLQDKNK